MEACSQLNWNVCVPSNEDETDDKIYGLIVGTPEYIDAIIGGADEFNDFFEDDPLKDLDEDDITLSNVDLSKKKVTH